MTSLSTEQRYHRIWETVRQIPPGRVASYGQVADLAGLPGRARLIGRALGATPIPLPWYRVLRSDGRLAFAAGSTSANKQARLLAEEQVTVLNNRVNMKEFGWRPDMADLLFSLKY